MADRNNLSIFQRTFEIGDQPYSFFSLEIAERQLGSLSHLPFCLKVIIENLLRFEDGQAVTEQDIQSVIKHPDPESKTHEIAFRPARVLMQDFTGVPAIVDLAAMREAIIQLGDDPCKINPLTPVDLIIDHSVMVDQFAKPDAFDVNVTKEIERNKERYSFLNWGQQSFENFRVVPPGTGICHQVNLEYLGKVVWTEAQNGTLLAYPDTLVGTDSHTTMINGLAILGWGVGGIEAEAAMLGQPISILIPEVIGFKLTGGLREGTTATDLVLAVTQMLRNKGVVGKFVEFYGPGLDQLTIADRATIANMSPEYGATCGFFPIDQALLDYLKFTGRPDSHVHLVEAYAKNQGLWRTPEAPDPLFSDTLELNIETVEPCLAGPRRPQDRILLSQSVTAFDEALSETQSKPSKAPAVRYNNQDFILENGSVVIAAITSCTNTSNPSVMIGAGLLARNAHQKGLAAKPWVKTSLAPGSKVVMDYLHQAGLVNDLEKLGFYLVGFGCTTCIGNSGPLPGPISKAIDEHDLTVAGVLSGNRNFEGRIHSQVKFNYLASPPLVVAYALAGSMAVDLQKDPLGHDGQGNPVYLKDIWPTQDEIRAVIGQSVTPEMFKTRYNDVFKGDEHWQALSVAPSTTYAWQPKSTYVKHPPFFKGLQSKPPQISAIRGARPLAILGNSVTTDHISPAGAIAADSPAGQYLQEHGITPDQFNSYGSRRGNHEVMMRGTFANIRLRNELVPGTHGGMTRHMPSGEVVSIYDAAMQYAKEQVPLVIVAGREYGTGSSRDWAAKGSRLLGIKAVIAESFERIHRSNLIGMGVLPLTFTEGVNRFILGLDGHELFDIEGFEDNLTPGQEIQCRITHPDGRTQTTTLLCMIDTSNEVEYYQNGGILHNVLRGSRNQKSEIRNQKSV
ncbi:MAG: aconitate hydratase AcnA [Pseudomonadota bacterium]